MPMTAKGLSKLIEECGELQQVCGKKLAYFHTDVHPDGAGSLKERLEKEIADVQAACDLVIDTLGLDWEYVHKRRQQKHILFHKWHAMPDNNVNGVDRLAPQGSEK